MGPDKIKQICSTGKCHLKKKNEGWFNILEVSQNTDKEIDIREVDPLNYC